MSGSARCRRAAGLTLLLLAVFVGLLTSAVVVYPGGSWADPRAEGFRPLVNYWCDLMRTQVPDGRPNGAASVLGQLAFGALAGSLAAFWIAAAALVPATIARRARVLGTVSCLGVVLVALSPYDTAREWHAVTTLTAGGSGFAAAVLLIAGSLQAAPLGRWRNVWGIALLIAACANIVVYVDCVLHGGDSSTLPIIQLSATIFLVLWMAATALDARAAGRAETA